MRITAKVCPRRKILHSILKDKMIKDKIISYNYFVLNYFALCSLCSLVTLRLGGKDLILCKYKFRGSTKDTFKIDAQITLSLVTDYCV